MGLSIQHSLEWWGRANDSLLDVLYRRIFLFAFLIELYIFMCVRGLCTVHSFKPNSLSIHSLLYIYSWCSWWKQFPIELYGFCIDRIFSVLRCPRLFVERVRVRERGQNEHKEIIIPFNCGNNNNNSAVVRTNKRKCVCVCACVSMSQFTGRSEWISFHCIFDSIALSVFL